MKTTDFFISLCIYAYVCLPFVRFNPPWGDACLTSGYGLLFTGMTIPGRLTTSNPAEKSVDTNCPESCTDLPDGPYASCKGCERFMYCHKGEMFDVYTCPDGEFWDDIAKDCLNTTSTCHPLRSCVQTCEGIDNGNYQSCQSCNVYATCSNGFVIDGRPCGPGLVWDDEKKLCAYESSTCR